MPEGEVLVLINIGDKQVRNVHTYLWTPCTTYFIKKALEGSTEECLFTSAWLNRSSFHAWGWEEVAGLREVWGVEDRAERRGRASKQGTCSVRRDRGTSGKSSSVVGSLG